MKELEQLVQEETNNLRQAEQNLSNAFYVRDVIRNTLAAMQKKLQENKEEEPKKKK